MMLGLVKAGISRSPIGLASISVAVAIVWGCSVAFDLQLSTVGSDPGENHFAEGLLVICALGEIAFLAGLGSLLGIALSLASLVCGERRVFGVVGLALNGAILAITSKVIHTIVGG
jgi:hypothetical protein